MAIGMTSSVKSKRTFGADTFLFGSNLSLGSNSAHTCFGVSVPVVYVGRDDFGMTRGN